jgi:hypothetical protein
MNPVLYVCFAPKGESEGFVFPSELENLEYSPGINVVVAEYYYRFDESYLFEAYDGDRVIKLTLSRARKNVFRVSTKKYGTFFFKAKMIPKKYNNYLGKYFHLARKHRIYQLIAFQPNRLEEVCKRANFFFLGSIDREITM